MGILKDRFLIIILITGLLIRLLLTPIAGFKFDVDTWFAWADRLNSLGFANFYSDKVWTSYPPGFLYVLSFLGFLKNLFHIDASLFYIVLKVPSILSDLILGILIYQLIPNHYKVWKKIGLFLVIFNPAFIFNSAIFGQFDGLFSLTLLLSIYFLSKKSLILSSIFWGLSFLLKPQAILVLPVLGFYILKNFSLKSIIKLSLPATLVNFLLFLPFFKNNILNGPTHLVSTLMGYYPYNSIFAYNFWSIFGFWVPDNTMIFSISYQYWGYILFAIYSIILGYFYLWKKRDFSLLSLATLLSLSSFFLLTRMHERYLYPSLVFLILITVIQKSRILVVLGIFLSLIHFINLYYVYIYYQVFYLKLQTIIYSVLFYDFADKNLRIISIAATLIFLLISINILKFNHEIKKS